MRMKHLLMLLAMVLATPAIAQEAAPDPLMAAENQIVTAWESLQSARGVLNIAVQLDIADMALPVQASGPFAYKKHEGKRLFRVDLGGDITAPSVSPTAALPVEALGVFDGAVANIMTNMLFQKTVMRHKPAEKDLAVGGDALFKALHEDCDVRLLGDRAFNAISCYVIEADVRTPGDDVLEPVKWNLCFAKDTGLPVLAQAFDRRGRVIFKSFMTDIALNPALNLAQFTFVAPSDARIVEGDDFSQLIPIPR
ncbi:MAG TPA: hypothetical protein PKJ78_14455 [Candidatus Hydrogenedentes bacterium]|nr:hypothetical protein [Candidatus Hydrogenedentota bacterium]